MLGIIISVKSKEESKVEPPQKKEKIETGLIKLFDFSLDRDIKTTIKTKDNN